jgi:tetratricopeptide (TPR) repeat protein
MRAYAVLADIRAEAGDADQAKSFHEVVAAIRMAEDADRLIDAGLLKRGIALYEQSLNHFADAYCIQSRLALQLTNAGEFEQAEEHYRRAYELMPDSFGRVESHCFGCEGAFRGERAQGVAETVFSKLLTTQPKKPQVHYLLGYLRFEQQRYPEALTLFREAVALDPDYLNAWNKIRELDDQIHLPNGDLDNVTFTLMRLDPMSHHANPDYSRVTDLKRLWAAAEQAAKVAPHPETEPLMELTASKIRHAKSADDPRQAMIREMMARATGTKSTDEPARVIARQGVISATLQYLNMPDYP